MQPLQCKIDPDRLYFYCAVVIGHMLPDNDWARDWEIPGEIIAARLKWCAEEPGRERYVWNTGAVHGIWRFPDDRSIAHAIVALAKDPCVMITLPKSGMEIRKQIKRPDLLQTFGPDDRGIYTTQVGSHTIDFIVGWPTEEAAKKAYRDIYYPDAIEAYVRMARGILDKSAIPIRTMYCAPPHGAARPEQVEALYEAFLSGPWNGPALVGYWGNDYVQLLSGSHRWESAKLAGLPHIPVVLYSHAEIESAWGNEQKWAKIMNSGAAFAITQKYLDFPL
jgi:hypothetical protein